MTLRRGEPSIQARAQKARAIRAVTEDWIRGRKLYGEPLTPQTALRATNSSEVDRKYTGRKDTPRVVERVRIGEVTETS